MDTDVAPSSAYRTVVVPGAGAYGFQAVGTASATVGFDVRFHPVGAPSPIPGHARMRVCIGDDADWSVEFVSSFGLDRDLLESAVVPARAWLEANQVTLMLSLLGAAETELRRVHDERRRLTLAHETRVEWLRQDRQGTFAPRTAHWRSPDAVAEARDRLAAFERRVADREAILGLVVGAALRFSQVRTRWTATFSELMAEVRDHVVLGNVARSAA